MRYALLAALLTLLLIGAAHAEEAPKPDDHVAFELAAEDWVTTKTARVTVNVEAAVSGGSAGTMRADMLKAVGGIAAGDWRLVNFNRGQDQTGLERWSASFEARLPETTLGGLGDNAKKLSKAGMQLSIADIDFSPTLEETEAVRSGLRTQLYKKIADQLTSLNSTLPGRTYRIAAIDFGNDEVQPPRPRVMMKRQVAMAMAPGEDSAAGIERSEKIRLVANIILATDAGAHVK